MDEIKRIFLGIVIIYGAINMFLGLTTGSWFALFPFARDNPLLAYLNIGFTVIGAICAVGFVIQKIKEH